MILMFLFKESYLPCYECFLYISMVHEVWMFTVSMVHKCMNYCFNGQNEWMNDYHLYGSE
jgi:hypothetical protein